MVSPAFVRKLPVLMLVALAACSASPRTEVIVVVDTDLTIPDAIDRIAIEVTSPSGATREAVAVLGEGEPSPPRTLGLLPEGGVLGPYDVVARGLLGESEVVARRARFSFVPDTTAVLTMHLVEDCVGRDCGARTCGERGCEDVARVDLSVWTGTPPRLGETPPPLDAGIDAGPGDAGPGDSGEVDACTAELCNDADDDCDGRTDEGLGGDEVCNGMDDDCDGATDEGFALQTDLENCGECGRRCVFRNGEGICNAGTCTVTSCTAPFDDCDGSGDKAARRTRTPPHRTAVRVETSAETPSVCVARGPAPAGAEALSLATRSSSWRSSRVGAVPSQRNNPKLALRRTSSSRAARAGGSIPAKRSRIS